MFHGTLKSRFRLNPILNADSIHKESTLNQIYTEIGSSQMIKAEEVSPPIVFVSYSHDSAPHKAWVLKFATTLRNRGIDAVLDQWDLRPGDDVPHFMETHLATCDFALMICTDRYVEKANAGEGGVGYEKMIMTASLLPKIDSNKLIPIVRQAGGKDLPTFMKSKMYIDFSNDEDAEYRFDELLRTLLKAPLYIKPPIGTAPFAPIGAARPDRTSDGIRSVMEGVAQAKNENSRGTIWFDNAAQRSGLHRLAFERYFNEAAKKGLVVRVANEIELPDKGIDYIFSQGIVE